MALTVAAAWACAPTQNNVLSSERQPMVTQGLSDGALRSLAGRMDPAMRGLALRHDPGLQQPDLWNRAEGWASLDIRTVPDLGFTAAEAQTAQDVNALMPFAGLPIRPMRPFLLKGGGEDRARAEECLSQAVYYESAREPQKGQAAVAQVVLNRVRHPAYPKSVCGVVYQGAARATGCQFTFTCDGSLRWKPEQALWRRAQGVARRALAGYVEKGVGSATHYHASYVAPYWAPTLVKMTQVGAHIFYRWTGPWGEPAAFTGRYVGREANLTQQVLASLDARTQGGLLTDTPLLLERKVTLAMAGEVRTYRVLDPNTPSGERTRVMGTLYAPRRQPTPDEIRKINESLAAVERSLDAPAPPALVIPPPAKAEAQPAKASG